ncbi:MAG: hypothetical protein M1358_24960, partial [Chloroflexi bacterium]|nr:hypothetical protein [Chloroflexota bacterium]
MSCDVGANLVFARGGSSDVPELNGEPQTRYNRHRTEQTDGVTSPLPLGAQGRTGSGNGFIALERTSPLALWKRERDRVRELLELPNPHPNPL